MKKVFLIDVARCSGCYNCQLACKDEHVGNDWRPYAAPQPRIGQFWCKVHEHVCGTIPKVKIHYLPGLCNHCEKAACLEACRFGAISRREDGFVCIDPAKCTGCGDCQRACYYDDVIYLNQDLHIAQKCTGCAHLLDNGAALPRCVDACPTDALRFVDEDQVEEGEPLVVGVGARVFYKNIPGKFIAGTVYDPVEKEVVIGGTCTLTGGGQTRTIQTDDYGDFWFRDLEVGHYDLSIVASGFLEKRFDDISTEADQNLGDIPLERTAGE